MKGKFYRLMNEHGDGGAEGGDASKATNIKFENFQKEMDKKLGGVTTQVDALIKSQQALIQQLAQKQAPVNQKDDDSDSDSHLLYSNPELWAKKKEEKIAEKVKKEVYSTINQQSEQQAKTNQILQSLIAEYPELSDVNSSLAQAAIRKYEALPENERNSTIAYKIAVKEAAEELDISPKSKRKSSDDDFSLGNNSGSMNRERGARLSPETIEFAKIMGLNVEDKKVVERLSKHAKRDFSRYQG